MTFSRAFAFLVYSVIVVSLSTVVSVAVVLYVLDTIVQ